MPDGNLLLYNTATHAITCISYLSLFVCRTFGRAAQWGSARWRLGGAARRCLGGAARWRLGGAAGGPTSCSHRCAREMGPPYFGDPQPYIASGMGTPGPYNTSDIGPRDRAI